MQDKLNEDLRKGRVVKYPIHNQVATIYKLADEYVIDYKDNIEIFNTYTKLDNYIKGLENE